MAPVAVVLNLRTHARTAVCNGDYQRGRPATGIKQPTDRHQLVLVAQPASADISEMEQAALHHS